MKQLRRQKDIKNSKCLLVIDVQNDFCPGGKLPIEKGDEVVPIINQLMQSGEYELIVASQEMHPANHISFASQHVGYEDDLFKSITLNSGMRQILWPDHAIQDTKGCELHPELRRDLIDYIQVKGQDPLMDSYSTFYDNAKQSKTVLDLYLKQHNLDEIHICGIAADFCVKHSALDAKVLFPDMKIVLLNFASRGSSNVSVNKAVDEMQKAGIIIRYS